VDATGAGVGDRVVLGQSVKTEGVTRAARVGPTMGLGKKVSRKDGC